MSFVILKGPLAGSRNASVLVSFAAFLPGFVPVCGVDCARQAHRVQSSTSAVSIPVSMTLQPLTLLRAPPPSPRRCVCERESRDPAAAVFRLGLIVEARTRPPETADLVLHFTRRSGKPWPQIAGDCNRGGRVWGLPLGQLRRTHIT